MYEPLVTMLPVLMDKPLVGAPEGLPLAPPLHGGQVHECSKCDRDCWVWGQVQLNLIAGGVPALCYYCATEMLTLPPDA